MQGPRDGGSVVVPAVETAGSLSVVRSLGRQDLHTVVVSEHEAPLVQFPVRGRSQGGAVARGRPAGLPGRAARSRGATTGGLLVPVREQDVYVLAKHRRAFARHVGTPWPTFEQVSRVHDRVRLFEAAERAGVTVPDTAPLDATVPEPLAGDHPTPLWRNGPAELRVGRVDNPTCHAERYCSERVSRTSAPLRTRSSQCGQTRGPSSFSGVKTWAYRRVTNDPQCWHTGIIDPR